MEEAKTALEVAESISNFGMMAVAAAFFIVLAIVIMVMFVKWFKDIINSIMTTNEVDSRRTETGNASQGADHERNGIPACAIPTARHHRHGTDRKPHSQPTGHGSEDRQARTEPTRRDERQVCLL